MSVTPSPIGGFAAQFFDNNGVILSGGKIYTYAAGTTTPQAVYTSASGATPHANPIILDSAGRVPGGEIWLTDGLVYKFVIETATAILIGTYDNITGINSNFVNYTIQEEVQTATANQTVFNLTTMNYTPATNSLTVYIDGVNQYVGDSYIETDSDTVTFTSGVHVGGEVKFTTAIQTTTGAVDASIVTYDPPFTGGVITNVEDKLAQYVSVKDFGAVGNGVANDTAAFTAAFAVNSRIYIPAGTYIVDTLNIPGVYGFELIGAGQNRTILQASAANQTILRKQLVAGAVEYGYIGHFSLKAHSAGSTGPAFNCSGFRQVKFAHINGLSNGSNGFASLFSVAADPYLTYGCIWDCPTLAEQTGWGKVFDFNNNSTTAAGNANASIILNPWIYANVGLSIALDLARSTQTNVIGGLIEGNTGATAIRWGSASYINGIWLESNGTDLVPGTLGDGTGNNAKIIGNYLSSNPAINLAGVSNCYILQNTAPVAATFSNVGNNVCLSENNPTIAAPTVARSSGDTGTFTFVSATQSERMSISGCITYELLYTWNADTAATNTTFAVTIPAGWSATSVAASSVRDASGEPGRTASNLANIYHYNQYDDNTSMLISVRMQKT